MKQRGSGSVRWLGVAVLVGACGQELELPQGQSKANKSLADGPLDGITGAAGVAAEESPSRLPLPTEPTYTSFGGDGGQADVEEPGAPPAHGGATGSKPSGYAGSRATSGGAAGRGGTSGTSPLGGADGAGAPGQSSEPDQLLFSEYVEGSGSFKALELYSPVAISLEDCELQTFFNGKTQPSRLALHGELPAGGVQVLCSSALATAQPARCSRSTSLTFNGDDALALSCHGVVLDVIGEIGVDPGDSWASGATADHTLRRRCSVEHGRAANEPFAVDAEWVTLGIDTFADLGQRVCATP